MKLMIGKPKYEYGFGPYDGHEHRIIFMCVLAWKNGCLGFFSTQPPVDRRP